MAHFYGTVHGARGTTTCSGHNDLLVTAQSFEGDILINLVRTEEGDKVELVVHEHGHSHLTQLYFGFIKDLLDMEKRAAQMHALGLHKFVEGLEGRVT